MNSMPERPRSHVLADEAVAAFRTLFHPWVVRTFESNDYGVDAEVEIFDDEGRATGQSFKAQIKGTDAKPKRKYTVPIKITTLNYWHSHDVPVLVYLFVAASNEGYARWAHTYEPPRNARKVDDAGKTSFSFTRSDLTTHGYTPTRIKSDVAAIRALKYRSTSGPIPVRVRASIKNLSVDEKTELEDFAERVLSSFSGSFVVVRENTADSLAEVVLERKSFRFSMPANISSVTVHLDSETNDPLTRRILAPLLTAAAATELAVLGMDAQAIEVFGHVSREHVLQLSPFAVSAVFQAYLNQRRPDDALGLILPFLSADVAELANFGRVLLTPIVFGQNGTLSDPARESLMATLGDLVDRYRASGEAVQAGEHAYLAAGIARACWEFERAIPFYRLVGDLDPRYYERGYYHRELGGCLADLERWHEATECYEKSRACPDRPEDIDFVYGDALLRSGRYQAAFEVAGGSSNDPEVPRQRSILVREVAALAVEELGLVVQNRHQLLEEVARSLPDYEDGVSFLRVLASTDALDAQLLARAASNLPIEQAELTLRLMVATAWVERISCRAWMLTLFLAIDMQVEQEFLDVLSDQCFRSGVEVVDELMAEFRVSWPDDLWSRMRSCLNRRRRLPVYQPPTVMRLIDPETGNIAVLELPRDV